MKKGLKKLEMLFASRLKRKVSLRKPSSSKGTCKSQHFNKRQIKDLSFPFQPESLKIVFIILKERHRVLI